jgi:hypothetical protein
MISNDVERPLRATKPMKAFVNARKCRTLATGGKYKIDKNHHFNVYLVGLLGKLPKSEDI